MAQLWDYVDQELTPDRMQQVHQHLTQCAHCLPHAQFAERFLSALHATREETGGCPQAVRAQVMLKLREAGLSVT